MRRSLTLDKLGGGLERKRVKQSKNGGKSVIWMQGHLHLKMAKVKQMQDVIEEQSEA
ncbi:hypothetical protein Hdeb2414_s0007g00240641 [Helianthus debilis subsp. tardiflorus]